MSVEICPICRGRGTVSASFYEPWRAEGTAVPHQVTCRACGGSGVIIVPESKPIYWPRPTPDHKKR